MAQTCDVLVHVGDTMAGIIPCNRQYMTKAVHILTQTAAKYNKVALYAPGNSELVDCHEHSSKERTRHYLSDFYTADAARKFLIENLLLQTPYDLTQSFPVSNHESEQHQCQFDKYFELDHYSVATLEVPGSSWYLNDQTNNGCPYQNDTDPLLNRLHLYLNAKDCAMEWIETTAKRPSDSGKRALSFCFMPSFTGMGQMSL